MAPGPDAFLSTRRVTNTVYALDSTSLLDLRGNIPADGKLHDVHALDMLLPEAGAIYVVEVVSVPRGGVILRGWQLVHGKLHLGT